MMHNNLQSQVSGIYSFSLSETGNRVANANPNPYVLGSCVLFYNLKKYSNIFSWFDF